LGCRPWRRSLPVQPERNDRQQYRYRKDVRKAVKAGKGQAGAPACTWAPYGASVKGAMTSNAIKGGANGSNSYS
ncbi:hypothetical protein, partial [Serratia nevei]|uniref:hypothetical protein n=1 Tax=Serratia nevei TaxID=2703794 RepID=UPI00301AC7AE